MTEVTEERTVMMGPLSNRATFWLTVKGSFGPHEIERPSAKLEFDKAFLTDDEYRTRSTDEGGAS